MWIYENACEGESNVNVDQARGDFKALVSYDRRMHALLRTTGPLVQTTLPTLIIQPPGFV